MVGDKSLYFNCSSSSDDDDDDDDESPPPPSCPCQGALFHADDNDDDDDASMERGIMKIPCSTSRNPHRVNLRLGLEISSRYLMVDFVSSLSLALGGGSSVHTSRCYQ